MFPDSNWLRKVLFIYYFIDIVGNFLQMLFGL